MEQEFELRNAPPYGFALGSRTKTNVTLDAFAGPLDVLLLSIKKNQYNIFDIPIAEITEEFLEYLDYAVTCDLDRLTEFYAMAADLLYIKSRMLLPAGSLEDEEDIEDPRDELIEKLIEYQKFKQLSSLMEEKLDLEEWSFERKKIQRSLPFEEENLWDRVDTWALLQDMHKIFTRLTASYSSEKILDFLEEVTINEKLTLLTELLQNKGECLFAELIVRRGNMLDVVCAFMAILEAVKSKVANIYQNRMFGDIKICAVQGA
ncbi:MAG: segregation/condensation protein A [Spirochaetaceae bacterium]|jgi:segregation and condensation protein A|nr:segregation/condensation protein A [Spirochaetaceae bacterium]